MLQYSSVFWICILVITIEKSLNPAEGWGVIILYVMYYFL